MARACRVLPAVVVGIVVALSSCGGPPPRPSTHGYRAVATRRDGAASPVSWDLAVRGPDRRKQAAGDDKARVLVVRGDLKRAYELDPTDKTARELPFESLDAFWPGHPLETGFSAAAEAHRRGVSQYRRESDAVFAGHVCQIWSFAENPEDELSPYTTYWSAADLEGLVLRVDRKKRLPDGTWTSDTTELLDVRLVAPPKLFEIPKAYRIVKN